MKVTRYIILTHPRSASTNFGKTLARHPQVDFAGELFNNSLAYNDLLDRQYGMTVWSGSGLGAEAYADRMMGLMRSRPVWGFKVFKDDLPEDQLKEVIGWADKVIILQREDMMAAAISYQKAVQTGRWEAGQAGNGRQAVIDEQQAAAWAERQRHAMLRFHVISATLRKQMLFMTYEELVKEPAAWKMVFDFLEVPAIEVKLMGKKLTDHGTNT